VEVRGTLGAMPHHMCISEVWMMLTTPLEGAETSQLPCSSVYWKSQTSKYILILLGPVKETQSAGIPYWLLWLGWSLSDKRLEGHQVWRTKSNQFIVFLYLVPSAYYLQTFSLNQVSLLS